MKFLASLFSVKKGREGDVKLVLEIVKTEAMATDILSIPEEVNLEVEINPEGPK